MFKTIINNLNVFVTRKLNQFYLNNIILKRFSSSMQLLNTSFLMNLRLKNGMVYQSTKDYKFLQVIEALTVITLTSVLGFC